MGGARKRRTLGRENPPHRFRRRLFPDQLFGEFSFPRRDSHLQYSFLDKITSRSALIQEVEDDHHIEEILAGDAFKESGLQESADIDTSTATPGQESKSKYTHYFSRDTVDYIVTSTGHAIGLRTKYKSSDLKTYTIQLRKHDDPLLKRKYKNALKQHDTLDMIQDAMKLGLVSYAEILGHGLSHIYRGGSTLDVGKGFVGGLSASKERKWAGLSGDKAG